MTELRKHLAEELDPINAALEALAGQLPVSVRPVAGHILAAGGKRLRPFLTVLCARLLGYAGKDVYELAACMEMLHMATLLHDDVLDNADLRRGKKAAHLQFGIRQAILAGDAILAAANAHVAGHGDPRLAVCFAEGTARTAAGEIMEIDYMRRCDQSMENYLEIAIGKTAWLIRAACEMGALKAGAGESEREALVEYGLNLGVAFQMVDDAIDFSPQSVTGKPEAGDVLEGKLTPPLFLYRRKLNENERAAFDGAFVTGMLTANDAARIAEEIRREGLDRAARDMAGEHLRKAASALDMLPDRPERELLGQMIVYVRDREK